MDKSDMDTALTALDTDCAAAVVAAGKALHDALLVAKAAGYEVSHRFRLDSLLSISVSETSAVKTAVPPAPVVAEDDEEPLPGGFDEDGSLPPPSATASSD